MKIKTDEEDKPTDTSHHVLIEAALKGTSVCVDIFGCSKDMIDRLRLVMLETLQEFK